MSLDQQLTAFFVQNSSKSEKMNKIEFVKKGVNNVYMLEAFQRVTGVLEIFIKLYPGNKIILVFCITCYLCLIQNSNL